MERSTKVVLRFYIFTVEKNVIFIENSKKLRMYTG